MNNEDLEKVTDVIEQAAQAAMKEEDSWVYGVAEKDNPTAEPIMVFMRYDQAKAFLECLGVGEVEYHVVIRGDQQFYGTPGIHQFMH